MSHRFVRCPHCKMPHEAAERVCPTTGRPLGSAPRIASRMSEEPPPERRPEPLGFDAVRHRITPFSHDLVGQTVGGRYLIRSILGEGGMGTVYDAEHRGLSRSVAVKVLSPQQAKKRVAVKRFQQEARAAGAIGHPNICEVYDMGLLDDGSPYLVMEKLVGQTLADRIAREGGLPFDDIIDVMIEVLSGLIAAHEKGIVHRDIKPENIFLARRVGCPPIVKILDFGVSKMMPQFVTDGEELDLTRTGMVMGTPYYMSPEQARGERNLDGRVDVYACGVMMYEAITGKRPFVAPNYNALLLSIISSKPRPLREVRPATPPALEAIVARAMAKARDDRYPSAERVLRDLRVVPLTGRAAVDVPVPPPPTPEERARAPVAGGGRRTRSVSERPSAVLRSRMAEPARDESAPATRLDIKIKAPAPPRSSDSIDIPIEIADSEVLAAAAPAPASDYDDVPTEIFRPGKHPRPSVARPPPSARDDWDSETIVKRPTGGYAPTPRGARPVPKPMPKPAPKPAPKAKPTDSIEVDFSDETQLIKPRPRRT